MRQLLSVFCLQVLLCLAACSIYRRENVVDKGDYIEICKQAPIELGIVLDSSSSIRHSDFQKGIQFLVEFLEHFEIGTGREGVRVSIITYGRGIYPEDGFNLTNYDTKEEVLNAVSQIPHRAGLYTDTGKAIKYMHEVQLNPAVVRSYAEKISIVITDGNSQEWKVTKAQSENARAAGITMFAIGVGNVKESELLNIAGDASRVTKVESYDELSTIKQTLASKTCIKKDKPTEPPKIESCGEINPADVNFVFSPASLGPDGTSWTTRFISTIISSQELEVGFRFGAITGSCPDDEGFDLDTYSTVAEYHARLASYEVKGSRRLVQRLVADGFSEERGGRTGASKVAVIVVSGGSNEAAALEEYVRQLTASGVRVFIADPRDSGVQITGAETLKGRSSESQSKDLIAALCPTSQ